MVDKNGFHYLHQTSGIIKNNINYIFFHEEMIENVSFYIDEDDSKNQIAVLNIEATNGSELTFYELLKKDSNTSDKSEKNLCRGSFHSVFESIFQVNHKNIIESRGTHSWNHGVGMEGFQSFEEPLDLLNISFGKILEAIDIIIKQMSCLILIPTHKIYFKRLVFRNLIFWLMMERI